MVDEPDSTSQQGTEMPFHCEICADDFDWETLRSLETHKLCDHDVRREDLVTFRDEPPKYKIELDAVETDLVCEPPTNKSSVLNGLRNLTVDDLAKLELSDLAVIRYSFVSYVNCDCDIVPMEEITALEAPLVSYGSVIKTGISAGNPYEREVILCMTCGSRMIKDGSMRDICLCGCPPGFAGRTAKVVPYGYQIYRPTNPKYLPIL